MIDLQPAGVALVIIAKAPISGQVKTRLVPPATHDQAAGLAAAALADTIAAVQATPSERRILLFEGDATWHAPAGFEVIPQRSGDLGDRLTGAFADIGGPAVIIAMDTPQVLPSDLLAAQVALAGGADAVYGPAADGGYWLIGLRSARGDEFSGVPMSLETTGEHQRKRLAELDLSVAELRTLVDVDTMAAATQVANETPSLSFSRLLRSTMQSETSVDLARPAPGSLIELIGADAAPLLLRGMYNGGDPGPIVAALAQVPELCLPTVPYIGAALGASAVSVRLKEIMILRTSALLECNYCVNAHTVVAVDTGLSLDEAKSLRGELPLADVFTNAAEVALLDFIEAMATGRGALPASINEAIKANYSDAEIVEFAVTIGATMFLNRFATGLGLPTDLGTFTRLADLGLATGDTV